MLNQDHINEGLTESTWLANGQQGNQILTFGLCMGPAASLPRAENSLRKDTRSWFWFTIAQDFTLITDNNKKGRGRIRSNLGEGKGFNKSRCHCSTGKVLDSILWCLLGRSIYNILESILLRCQESHSGLIYPSWTYFGMAQEACTCHKNCTVMYMKEFEMPDSVGYKFCAGSLRFFFSIGPISFSCVLVSWEQCCKIRWASASIYALRGYKQDITKEDQALRLH